MLGASVLCFLVAFVFANLLVNGLVSGESAKPEVKLVSVDRGVDLPQAEGLSGALSNATYTVKSANAPIERSNVDQIKTSEAEIKSPDDNTSTEAKPDKPGNAKVNGTNSENATNEKNSKPPVTAGDPSNKPNSENEAESTTDAAETESTTKEETAKSSTTTSATTEVSSLTSSEVSPSTVAATNYTTMSTTSTEEIELVVKPEQSEVSIEKKDEGMSSGIIALVMAIVFAVVVIIVYVGLLLWRRYLEYRYGNRELLVNDLEFDTNDLRHFEL